MTVSCEFSNQRRAVVGEGILLGLCKENVKASSVPKFINLYDFNYDAYFDTHSGTSELTFEMPNRDVEIVLIGTYY